MKKYLVTADSLSHMASFNMLAAGHIQYQMAYKNQSFFHRDGANPAFHEGIADILSLAVGNYDFLIMTQCE